MILINLSGGPGAGKTTLSYYLAYRLKKEGFRTELVGEAARESHIYDASPTSVAPPLLDNQVLLAGQQYERILRLKRHNFEVAISDSPLIQGLLYCEGHAYYDALKATMRNLEKNFDTYSVMILPRPGSYDPESRVQRTEEAARAFDKVARKLVGKFWLEIGWDQEEFLAEKVIALAKEKRFIDRRRTKKK